MDFPNEVRRLEAQLADARAEAASNASNPACSGNPTFGQRQSLKGGRHGSGGADGFAGGTAGRSLSEPEDAFLRAERLADELARLRDEKRALELQVFA